MGLLDDLGLDVLTQELIGELVDSEIDIKYENTTYDPLTDIETGPFVTETLKASPPIRFKQSQVDGESIQRDDVYFIVPAPSIAMDMVIGRELCHATVRYYVQAVDPVYSGDDIIFYKLHCRK